MPYRLLHVIASVNPQGGGPIEGLKQLAAVNQRAGHVVEVASLDAPADPWVASCPLRCFALGPGRTAYRYSARLVPWLRRHAAEYDAVIVDGVWSYNSFGVWRALHGTRTPYFVFTHGMLDPWFKRQYPRKHLKKWLFWPWGDYRVLRDARAVLFTCEEERRLARQSFWLYRAREHVVKFGTAIPAGDAVAQRTLFAQTFPATAGRRLVLFLGRVHPKKGADLLLRAYARIRERGEGTAVGVSQPGGNVRDNRAPLLVMAGPDDHAYGAEMKRLCRDLGVENDVVWTGMLAGDLKWGAFHAAEVFALPSHQENFGIAVAEALACGVPVLISNRVNIWREIAADDAGLVEDDTLAGTERLLARWFAQSAADRAAMGQRARATFAARFHIEAAAASLLEALEKFGVPPGSREDAMARGKAEL